MNKINISLLSDKLQNNKWLLNPTAHNSLQNLVTSYIANPNIVLPDINEDLLNNSNNNNDTSDNLTAIISISGVLVKGCSNLEEKLFGLVNTDYIKSCLEDALQDETVKDIVLFFNSPGGETTGIEELQRKILEVDNIKPVYAYTETMMCSAAYWLASACRSIGMTPSSTVGSIGVYSLIQDCSKAYEQEGINIQSISSGKYKLLGANFKPLTEEEKQILQEEVTAQHEKFKAAVNTRRNIKTECMEGQTFEGKSALDNNLVDFVVDELNQYLSLTTVKEKEIESMKEYNKVNKMANVEQPAITAEVPAEPTEPDGDETECICPHCGKKSTDAVVPAPAPAAEVVATASINEQWNNIFNRKPTRNAFYEAAIQHVKSFKV